jgi:hypothetical protein
MEASGRQSAEVFRGRRNLGRLPAAPLPAAIWCWASATAAIYSGENDVRSGDTAGNLLIGMNNFYPVTHKERCSKLKLPKAHFAECPVGGTVDEVRDGKLFGLAGGSSEDFVRAKPLLGQMRHRVEGVGGALPLAAPSCLSYRQMMDIWSYKSDTSGRSPC